MDKKTLFLFLAAFALGGVASYYLIGLLPQPVVEAPAVGAGQAPQGRPDWMADPAKVQPLDTSKNSDYGVKPKPKPKPKPKAEPEERERSLKVGVIGPQSGDGAVYGKAVLRGVKLAAERFNTLGGVGGKGIEVLHYDNKGSDSLTRDIFNDLVRKDVIAIFSAPTGWSTFAPTHLANSSRTILVSVGARRHIGRSGPYVFQYSTPDNIAVEDIVRHAIGLKGYKAFALVTSSSYDYSLDISSQFKQAVREQGGNIVIDSDTYDTFTGQKNIAAVAEAVKNSPQPIQAIIYTGGAEEAVLLARAVSASGAKIPLIGSEDLYANAFLEGGEAVAGSLVYATFSLDSGAPQLAEFMELTAKGGGGAPDRFTALAYDAFTFVAGAVRDAGALKSSKVRDTLLAGKQTDGVTGPASWDRDGVTIKHPFIYQVETEAGASRFVLAASRQ